MQLIPLNRNKKAKTDSELLETFLNNNNQEVLGELYSRHMHLVYGVCLKYFKNSEKAKDAVIELYEKVLVEVGKHEVGNFKSWLYVVAKNYCLMELRKTKPGNTVSVSSEKEMEIFMEKEVDLHPLDEEQNAALEKALANCIEKLKAEQQQCIRLFYYKNRCYREIAATLNIEEKKVKSFIQNGKRNLKICLDKQK